LRRGQTPFLFFREATVKHTIVGRKSRAGSRDHVLDNSRASSIGQEAVRDLRRNGQVRDRAYQLIYVNAAVSVTPPLLFVFT
jgi:hypothetical protein